MSLRSLCFPTGMSLCYRSLSEMSGAVVALKMEHLQRTGSFKTRGAYNKLSQGSSGAVERVVAASAGNHAQCSGAEAAGILTWQ